MVSLYSTMLWGRVATRDGDICKTNIQDSSSLPFSTRLTTPVLLWISWSIRL